MRRRATAAAVPLPSDQVQIDDVGTPPQPRGPFVDHVLTAIRVDKESLIDVCADPKVAAQPVAQLRQVDAGARENVVELLPGLEPRLNALQFGVDLGR